MTHPPSPKGGSDTAAWVVVVAQKRWGRGRLRQLARRALCRVLGHRWGVAKWLDDAVLDRRCERSCGAHNLLPPSVPYAIRYDELVSE